ncbi:TPA: hypothetical protein ACU8BH_001105 [Neisseria subflava]|jgi:hypothetical protein
MIFLLSGEGKTDFGQKNPTNGGVTVEYGPLSYILSKMVEEKFCYSPIELDNSNPDGCFYFFSKSELCDYSKNLSNSRKLTGMPGQKSSSLKGHGRLAFALGLKAIEISAEKNDEVIPVFFRDTDNSTNRDYIDKLESIKDGFTRAKTGPKNIPVLAKPKSEAWLLCIADDYCHGSVYEEGPANDDSPNSLKKQLGIKLADLEFTKDGYNYGNEDLCNFIKNFDLNFDKLCKELKSFKDFYSSFQVATQNANNQQDESSIILNN